MFRIRFDSGPRHPRLGPPIWAGARNRRVEPETMSRLLRIDRWPWKRLRRAHDPTVGLILWAVAILATAAAVVLGLWCAVSVIDTLTVFGGVLVLLASYFAARTLTETEADRATQMLASPSGAIRVAGIYRLHELMQHVPRYQDYVRKTLAAYLDEVNDQDPGYATATQIVAALDSA
jgi:hypothetical protein